MTKMTYVDALNIALTADLPEEVKEKLTALRDVTMKRGSSDKAKDARKAKTAEARGELVKVVAPVLRRGLETAPDGLTAKELFTACEKELPEGFSTAKVQNVLLREMAPELEKIESKNKANVYRLIRG